MEQLRRVGEALGSLKCLMVFEDDICVNKRQCSLLFETFNLAFEVITWEIRMSLSFDERHTKWKSLDSPLREFERIIREGEQYVRQCLDITEWLGKAISFGKSNDCVQLHLHDLLWCVAVVLESIEIAGEISACRHYCAKIIRSKKYDGEWMDPRVFRQEFGREYLISPDICRKMDLAWKEDQWLLKEKASAMSTASKHEHRLSEILDGSNRRIFPLSILLNSKDYKVKRRLEIDGNYKEIQWVGENFAVHNFFGEIEPFVSEITLLSSLSHPNVMPLFCAFFDEERKENFLLTKLMQKSLGNYMKEIISPRKKIAFSVPVAVDIMLQIARGMEYLHSRGIYLGNLNPSSILVKQRNITSSSSSEGLLLAKISDIRLPFAKNLKNSTNPYIWYAPEVLLEQEQNGLDSCESKFTEKSDVYSFGMICFELLTGKVPFEDSHLQGDKMSRNIRAGERPLFPFACPKYLSSLTKRCWQTDPFLRPGFSSISRVLRYIKRFLLLNPDQIPPLDFFDLETSFSRTFLDPGTVSSIPFEMFCFRVMEREKSSELGSEVTSVCGDENSSSGVSEDHQCSPPRQAKKTSKTKKELG